MNKHSRRFPDHLSIIVFAGVLLLAPAARAQFTDVTAAAGVDDPGAERGIAWGDYDGDGDPDLVVAVLRGQDRLLRNEGDGTFVDVSAAAGLTDSGDSTAPAWCDLDGDGDLDLYVARAGANLLYRNEGDGTFVETAAAVGADVGGVSWGASCADYDDDGHLDVYVVNFGGEPNRLLRGRDDGTFADVTAIAGVGDTGAGTSAAWADYDKDGDPDLYLVNKAQANRLFQNDGAGAFTDVAATAGIADTGPGTGAVWGDADGDGDLDLYLAVDRQPDRLFLNEGDGTFADGTEAAGLGCVAASRGTGWGDVDNDGDLDLFLTVADGPDRFYQNDGTGKFVDTARENGVADPGSGTTAAWADWDLDGDLDLAVSNFGDPLRLYRNDLKPGRHWLAVRLEAAGGNTRGLGALVVVGAGGVVWTRENTAGGGGYQSQAPQQLHFGLGASATVDSLVVRWPDGTVQRLFDIPADRVQTVRQR